MKIPQAAGVGTKYGVVGTWLAAAVLCAVIAVAPKGKKTTSSFTLQLQEYATAMEVMVPLPKSAPPGTRRHRRTIHVTEYYGKIAVGNPPQLFDVVFDTGSGNIVLPTVDCKDDVCVRHRRFRATGSSSSVQLAYEDDTPLPAGSTDRDTTSITYGTGKLTGEYMRDSFCFGYGVSKSTICTISDFLGVTQESRFPFSELPFDGIFGLGLSGLSTGPNFNFVSRLKANSSTIEPVISVFLRDLQAEEDSEITFGKWEEARIADGETLHWLPIPADEAQDKGYWLLNMREVYVAGKALGLCDDDGPNPRCKVAMDTGSALSMGSPYQIGELLDAIGMIDDCSNFGALPEVKFVFDAMDGGTFDMIFGPDDYVDRSTEGCAPTFQSLQLPPELGRMWVFGQTVLRKYYSVYDAKRWRVGIAVAKHTTQLRATTTTSTAPPAPGKKEVCEDDDAEMQKPPFQLQGCQTFVSMGYCKRFVPLAQHYCRLGCGLCKPPPTRPHKDEVTVQGRGIVMDHATSRVMSRRLDGEI